MRQLLFTGFNAFGQHEFVNGPHDDCAARGSGSDSSVCAGFSEINAHDGGSNNNKANKNQCTIALAWRYTAYALGRKLRLRGLLEAEPGECVDVEAPGEIKALAAGDSHCLVLLHTGELYKIQPKLEATLQAIRLEIPPRPCTATKRTIFGAAKAASSSSIIEHIACGTNINVAVGADNAVYSIPSFLHQFSNRQWRVQQLECGHEHALLLNGNGDVYTWGNGLRGQLGQVALSVKETPQLIESLAGIKITSIAAGGWHSAAISAFGDLYTWGLNSSGQLGVRVMKPGGLLKEPTVYPLPQLHDLPDCCCCCNRESGDEDDVCEPLKVFAGSRHTLLLRRCGRLWASGWCIHGQLGKQLCEQNFLDAFQALDGVGTDLDFVNVLCGPWATLLTVTKKKSCSSVDAIS